MWALAFTLCTTWPTPASDAGTQAQLTAPARAPREDPLQQIEAKVVGRLEHLQHLGSRRHTWLWVTPQLGGVTGVTFRFDFR